MLAQHFRIIDGYVEIIGCKKITKHCKEKQLNLSIAKIQPDHTYVKIPHCIKQD
jgi:hypothetical protein